MKRHRAATFYEEFIYSNFQADDSPMSWRRCGASGKSSADAQLIISSLIILVDMGGIASGVSASVREWSEVVEQQK